MATKAKKTEETSTAVVEKPKTDLSTVVDYGADAGAGLEGATADSFAIPFLGVLQKGSPQVDEASGVAIEGARAGMLFENVTGRMYPGKTGVLFVPCAYRRVFLRWGPRGGEGGGFKGELTADQVAIMRDKGEIKELDGRLYVPLPDGSINEKKCDRVSDTRNHYGLIVDAETGEWVTALLSLTSTQIKKSKMLASILSSRKVRTPAGMLPAPTWASTVRITTVPESNDKGSWYGVRFETEGELLRPDSDWYKAGREFNALVRAGSVQAKYEDTEEGAAAEAGGGGRF